MTRYDLDDILSVAEVPEVATRLGMKIEHRSGRVTALCPFHDDRRPSLVLYPGSIGNPSHFHCFTCNAHGFALDLVKKVQGLEFRPAIEWLAGTLGVQPANLATGRSGAGRSTRIEALSFARGVFDRVHDASAFDAWCADRDFSSDFLFSLGIRSLAVGSPLMAALREKTFGEQQFLIDGLMEVGLLVRLRGETRYTAQSSLDLNDQFRDYFHDGRVLIPIRSRKGELIGFAGRFRPQKALVSEDQESKPKYLLSPGFKKSDVLFNADWAQNALPEVSSESRSPCLYVVEGFLDALRLRALGIPSVAVMGTSISEPQRRELVEILDIIQPNNGRHPKLRLFFDRDLAGFNGVCRAARHLLGLAGIATEWVGFGEQDAALLGKDPDDLLRRAAREEASALLDAHSMPALGALIAANLGYTDATPLRSGERWIGISVYLRERALSQAIRTLRALGVASYQWAARLKDSAQHYPEWLSEFIALLGGGDESSHQRNVQKALENVFLSDEEARFNQARILAEYGSRRGELPCDDETWRALDRNAQIFNTLVRKRMGGTWEQAALYDAVSLPRKLTSDDSILDDPRLKVMPHASDLHLQQILMNELLTERHDFSHPGIRTFSDCIPAVRWFAADGEVRVTGYVEGGEHSPALNTTELDGFDEPVLSFAYQIDMDVLEGRRPPSDQGMFRPYIDCWRQFMSSLDRQAHSIGPHVYVLRLDAKRYYDNIQRYVVRDRLLKPIEQALHIVGHADFAAMLGIGPGDARSSAEALVDLLCGGLFNYGFMRPSDDAKELSKEIQGIPQGPVASAWVGTIAMFPVDAAARAFMREPENRQDGTSRSRVGYARYVDDIVLLADSEERLSALRDAVQLAAAHLELTLLRKGEPVAAGAPAAVMRQLNAGRALAPSTPAWEPPMTGDGETGWGMGEEDLVEMDRQSALHVLRHPDLLDDVSTVHEKVRNAMRAPDLRPSDLGKCARALWWQLGSQLAVGMHTEEQTWRSILSTFGTRWNALCEDFSWSIAFRSRGYDLLFAVEGLDMLIHSGSPMEKGRSLEWIAIHRAGLDQLSRAILNADELVPTVRTNLNAAHIRRRAKKVQWKALQRFPSYIGKAAVEPQSSKDWTLTEWFCQAAMLLRRYERNREAHHPLNALAKYERRPTLTDEMIVDASLYLKSPEEATAVTNTGALKIALDFLVANTTEESRWIVLSQYSALLRRDVGEPEPRLLPPLPIGEAGLLGFTPYGSELRLVAYGPSNNAPTTSAIGAMLQAGRAVEIPPVPLTWKQPEDLVVGLHRFDGAETVPLSFRDAPPTTGRARFAADLFDVLRRIQQQKPSDPDKERVIVMAHLAHDAFEGDPIAVEPCKWYLVSEPVLRTRLGVSAWVRDGLGGLRSLSVPAGEYAPLWRLGCAVTDGLGLARDVPSEESAVDEDGDVPSDFHQIEEYVLRQQLAKLRGSLLSSAQIRDGGGGALPGTVQRTLDILRRFDPSLSSADQVRLVLETETETRSMFLRLQKRGPSDLRDKLHLIPSLVLHRIPLSVLQCLPLHVADGSAPQRADVELLLGLASALRIDHSDDLALDPLVGSAAALHVATSLAAAAAALRGLVSSVWGIAKYGEPPSERLIIPQNWELPDAIRTDPQAEYQEIRRLILDDDWGSLREIGPWQWMLMLLGILNRVSPQTVEAASSNALRDVYECLRVWRSSPSEENGESTGWAWPFDGMPSYRPELWNVLLGALAKAISQVDRHIGIQVVRVHSPVFQRHRNSSTFSDAENRQWLLAQTQYTSFGSTENVARQRRGGGRWPTWTEARRIVDNELLSVHTVDDKMGQWWDGSSARLVEAREAAPQIGGDPNDDFDLAVPPVDRGLPDGVQVASLLDVAEDALSAVTRDDAAPRSPTVGGAGAPLDGGESGKGFESIRGAVTREQRSPEDLVTGTRRPVDASDNSLETARQFRASRANSLDARQKSKSHMRVALLQWRIDESYSHPLAEVGLQGMGLMERDLQTLRNALDRDSAMASAFTAAVRGNEHTWQAEVTSSVPSWPEHRRRRILASALETCASLKVDLLVLPEVSVRKETVDWLQAELRSRFPGVAVLAGTYRHFGHAAPEGSPSAGTPHTLMAPLTLLWRPDDALSKLLSAGSSHSGETLRFWRGKKYRAVAANELFRPDWNVLKPLFRVDTVIDRIVSAYERNQIDLPGLRAAMLSVAEQMPALRYCMELVCSELFLLTSPANISPLRHEIRNLLKRFPGASTDDAIEIVRVDHDSLGSLMSVDQEHSRARRSVLLVPAATARTNDYWHAGQASVLASGTATVFCNAAIKPLACGGSCFIGIGSATKPHDVLPGYIEALTPYHGWHKGILQADGSGALSDVDQALVVADIDPVHVVTGKPRPQLLPEPMCLVAYLPLIEVLDSNVTAASLCASLTAGDTGQISRDSDVAKVTDALRSVATKRARLKEPAALWKAFTDLRSADEAGRLEGEELDKFAHLFSDWKGVRERFLVWHRDRHQQPNASAGPLKLEPAWLDFLEVDLTIPHGQLLPEIDVPAWQIHDSE